MNERYIVGQKLFRALWTRHGLRIDEGKVLLANDMQFIVSCAGFSTESISQSDKGGWHPTRAEALKHQILRLDGALRLTEADAMRIRARIQSTKTMLDHAGLLDMGGAI